jgi:hypothetical protein
MIQKKHKDFLLKKMEQLSDSLAKLNGLLKEGKNNTKIIDETNSIIFNYFGENLTLLDSIELKKWLANSDFETQELIHLADIISIKLRVGEEPDLKLKLKQLQQFILEERKTFPFHWAENFNL